MSIENQIDRLIEKIEALTEVLERNTAYRVDASPTPSFPALNEKPAVVAPKAVPAAPVKAAPVTPAVVPPSAQPVAAPQYETVRAALTKLGSVKGRDGIMKVLGEFGVTQGTQLNPVHFPKVLERAAAELAA